jgi:hypothetical protein
MPARQIVGGRGKRFDLARGSQLDAISHLRIIPRIGGETGISTVGDKRLPKIASMASDVHVMF